jgi:hypothetical protein
MAIADPGATQPRWPYGSQQFRVLAFALFFHRRPKKKADV